MKQDNTATNGCATSPVTELMPPCGVRPSGLPPPFEAAFQTRQATPGDSRAPASGSRPRVPRAWQTCSTAQTARQNFPARLRNVGNRTSSDTRLPSPHRIEALFAVGQRARGNGNKMSARKSHAFNHLNSSTISPRNPLPILISLPTVTGSLNRRGPALPGFKYKTPFSVRIDGL